MWFVITLFISLFVAMVAILLQQELRDRRRRKHAVRRFNYYVEADIAKTMRLFSDDKGFVHPSQRDRYEAQAAELHEKHKDL